jgi:hypothetical protein
MPFINNMNERNKQIYSIFPLKGEANPDNTTYYVHKWEIIYDSSSGTTANEKTLINLLIGLREKKMCFMQLVADCLMYNIYTFMNIKY